MISATHAAVSWRCEPEHNPARERGDALVLYLEIGRHDEPAVVRASSQRQPVVAENVRLILRYVIWFTMRLARILSTWRVTVDKI